VFGTQKNNKECNSGSHDNLVGIHKNVILQRSKSVHINSVIIFFIVCINVAPLFLAKAHLCRFSIIIFHICFTFTKTSYQ